MATPTIHPTPNVPESAVHKAPNWLISPSAFGSLVTESLIALGILSWIKPVLQVVNMCEIVKIAIIGIPQIQVSICVTIAINASMINLSTGDLL